ncbi:MAG: N-6 DNA methylase [Akkermansiaceae bacterium]
MGTVFEELVRKFNEENNEEAGEHWTPRDAVRLMTNLVFRPISKQLKSGTYLLYDCACGTGGILTEGEETLQSLADSLGLQITAHLYGQEINPETYAICKADMLLKGEGENADKLEARLETWGDDDEEEGDDEDGSSKKKGLPEKKKQKLLDPKTWERDGRLLEAANTLRGELGSDLFEDYNEFRDQVDATLKALDFKLTAPDLKQILKTVSWRDENAPPVIGKIHKPGKSKPDPFHGLYEAKIAGKTCVVEYEADGDLKDTEQVPLLEDGGIEAFITREVLPYTPDAWADILAEEEAAEGLLGELLKGGKA